MKHKMIFLSVVIMILCLPGLLFARGSKKPEELRLLSWEGYCDDEWVKPFEEEHNVKIQVSYMGSDDELFAKLRGGKGLTYDMVSTNVAHLVPLSESDLIVPINKKNIPNYKDLIPAFQDTYSVVNGTLYSVPLCWGTINFCYNADYFKDKEPPTSYWDMWDPQYKGKVLGSEDAGINITTVGIMLGYDGYNLTDEQFEHVKKELLRVKPNLRALYTGFADAANFFASGEAILGMSQASLVTKLANEKGAHMVDLFPKGSLVWVDSWAITKGGEQKSKLCEEWINYSIGLDVQKIFIPKTFYGGVNAKLVDVLDQEVLKITHMDDFGIFERLTLMQNPESWEKRLKLWNEVKVTAVD